MRQSRRMSLIEAAVNIVIGMAIYTALNYWVMPYWGFRPSPRAAIEITLLYTVVSLSRSYVLRRVFNRVR